MDISLDQYKAGLTTIDTSTSSSNAFNAGSSTADPSSFDNLLQQATQQTSSGNGSDANLGTPPATTSNDNGSNVDPSPSDDGMKTHYITTSDYEHRLHRDDRSSNVRGATTDRKSRRVKSQHEDKDHAQQTNPSRNDQGSTPAANDPQNKGTADGSTATGNKDAVQVDAKQLPVDDEALKAATQATVAQTNVVVPGPAVPAVPTDGKTPGAASPAAPVTIAAAGNPADAAAANKAAAAQQAANTAAQTADQSATTTDATSTTQQGATQPGLAVQVAGKAAIQNAIPTDATQGASVASDAANAAKAQATTATAAPVLPTPQVSSVADTTSAVTTPSGNNSKSGKSSDNAADTSVTVAAPTAGLPAAIAAATLASTTVDTTSVDVTTPAVAAVSKTTDIKTDKGDANPAQSQSQTSTTNATFTSTLESTRPTITLGPQNTFGAEHGTSVSAADQARFVQRVANAFEASGKHDGPLLLRLSPPELGSMRLEISLKDGALTAHVQTDNSTARNLLLDNLPALRDRLEQQDIRIERFEVNVQDRSSGGQPQMPDQNPGTNDTGRRFRPTNTVATTESSEPVVQSGGVSLLGGGQLNVVI